MTAAMIAARMGALSKLLRLRRLHEDAARRERDKRHAALATARMAENERRQRIEQLAGEGKALSLWLGSSEALTMSRLPSLVVARGERIDDALERIRYALIDDRQAVADAQRALDDGLQAWHRARARTQAVELMLAQTRRLGLRQAEHAQERMAETGLRRSPLAQIEA